MKYATKVNWFILQHDKPTDPSFPNQFEANIIRTRNPLVKTIIYNLGKFMLYNQESTTIFTEAYLNQ